MGSLRLLLAISVLIAHSGPISGFSLIGGIEAVEIFFIISGFYMALILNTKYVGVNSYYLFITNRFLRIFPTYWLVLLLTTFCYLLGYVFYGEGGPIEQIGNALDTVNPLIVIAAIISNVMIFGQDILLFINLNLDGSASLAQQLDTSYPSTKDWLFVPQAWSISIELMFYLTAPFTLKLSSRKIIFLCLTSLSSRIFIDQVGLVEDPWNYRLFFSEYAFFLFGAIAYRCYEQLDKLNNLKKSILPMLSFCLMLLLLFFYQFVPYFYLKTYVLYALLIALLPMLFLYSKNNSIDRALGELSYPIYLIHIFIMMILSFFGYNSSFYVALITIFFSILMSKFFGNRIELIRKNRLESFNG